MRLVPDRGLPSATYIPGQTKKLDPAAYAPPAEPSPAAAWHQSQAFLWACDLFNHGCYWEAHEVWEGIWKSLGGRGTSADFVKGLIKLAAAGVKVREGNLAGVLRHARRARELFASVAEKSDGQDRCAGLSLLALRNVASELGRIDSIETSPFPGPCRVLPMLLLPEPTSSRTA